jgi:hypothetical protein
MKLLMGCPCCWYIYGQWPGVNTAHVLLDALVLPTPGQVILKEVYWHGGSENDA